MTVAERLEKSLKLFSENGWAKSRDRVELDDGRTGYCVRGAVVYGGFADETEHAWCEAFAEWHRGPCTDDDDWCGNLDRVELPEFSAVMDALDDAVNDLRGVGMLLGVMHYNDVVAKHQDEVIEVFRAAIDRAKEPKA